MQEYLELVDRVLANGVYKSNRTGVDTISCFAEHYTVDLSKGFPLLTTKKVNFKSMLYEVLWYLSGEPSLLIHHHRTAITKTGGCYGMETLGNVSISSAHGRCSVAALSCILWKAHHKFPHTRG